MTHRTTIHAVNGIEVSIDYDSGVITVNGCNFSREFFKAFEEMSHGNGTCFRLTRINDVTTLIPDPANDFWGKLEGRIMARNQPSEAEKDSFQAGFAKGTDVGADAGMNMERKVIRAELEAKLSKIGFAQMWAIWGGRKTTVGANAIAGASQLIDLVNVVKNFLEFLSK